jgi:hypothetical protein
MSQAYAEEGVVVQHIVLVVARDSSYRFRVAEDYMQLQYQAYSTICQTLAHQSDDGRLLQSADSTAQAERALAKS